MSPFLPWWLTTNWLLLPYDLGFWLWIAARAQRSGALDARGARAIAWLVAFFVAYASAIAYLSLRYDLFRSPAFGALVPGLWFPAPPIVIPLAVILSSRDRTDVFRRAVESIPLPAFAWFQSARIVSIGLVGKAALGEFPPILSVAGGACDALFGASALIVAARLRNGTLSRRAFLAWNAAGIAIVGLIGGVLATISIPGPFQILSGVNDMRPLLAFPMVLAPAIISPIMLFTQIASMLWGADPSPVRGGNRGADVLAAPRPFVDGRVAERGAVMLELRPTCEHCNVALPPDSVQARICSFECTFCAACVDRVLGNVCPNCGGGFVARPVRPANELGKYPASTKVHHRPVDAAAHERFAAPLRALPPERR